MNDDFRDFARSRAARLHRAAYLLCGDWHSAEDIVQETLVKTYLHWSRVQRATSPDAYVRRILVNEANRQWRRHRFAAVPAERPVADPAVRDDALGVTDRVALMQALRELTPRQRATVVLRYFEGLSERETADALNCSGGTVKSQSARALRTLSAHLDRPEVSV
jgi:RNA polymerase sigma-70 factor (sigma-E family)